MIEEGIVALVQGTPAVAAIAPAGGFLGTAFPKDSDLPTWTHLTVSEPGQYTLSGRQSLTKRRMQIDCYANDPDSVVLLAQAIDAVLDGYRGTLPDDDSTVVQGCFRTDLQDFHGDDTRTSRRMLEYEIWFVN